VYQDLFDSYKIIETDSVQEGILAIRRENSKGEAPLGDALSVMPKT
jgi:hypothetical protein